MPLLDHFRAPLKATRRWEGFHSKWANVLVDALNETLLPDGYYAEPQVHMGPRVEIDLAALDNRPIRGKAIAGGPWVPPPPALVMPGVEQDWFEIQVISTAAGPTLVGAIELVSPANKDRPIHRRAFAVKCASYLAQGVGLVVVDVVTERLANMHDEIVSLWPGAEGLRFPGGSPLCAVAYRPVHRDAGVQIEVWFSPITIGQTLPTLPLYLDVDLVVPIDLEATYASACRKLRLAG